MSERARLNLDPDDLARGLSRVVLVLLEVVRELLERQAVRRMEAGELTDDEIERLGSALMTLKDRLLHLRADMTDQRGDTDSADDDLSRLVRQIAALDVEGP